MDDGLIPIHMDCLTGPKPLLLASAWKVEVLVLTEVADERIAQDREWGGATHDDTHSPSEWVGYITKFAGVALSDDYQFGVTFRQALVKVAALAVAAIEANDRKKKM
jgi:hypothetical protein